MSKNNLPNVNNSHKIKIHLVTTKADFEYLRAKRTFQLLEKQSPILVEFIEDHEYNAKMIPRGFTAEKYYFLSLLQNLAFGRSVDFDAHCGHRPSQL